MYNLLEAKKAIIIRNKDAVYPLEKPFNPNEAYPEYPFKKDLARENQVYPMVRKIFYLHGMDLKNYGTELWNPLGELIKPGDKVLLKPNLVRHYHPYEWDITSIITHGSVIRAVLDYVCIALKGKGEIIIGDAPVQSCDFDKVTTETGLQDIKKFYHNKGINISIMDFRLIKMGKQNGKVESLPGDALGYSVIDLGTKSCFTPVNKNFKKFRVTCYNPDKMTKYHNETNHQYVISNTVLQANVVINLPKMKTHGKAGISGALKNLVGINGHKDCLPHHTKGSKEDGADEYLYRGRLKKIYSDLLDKSESTTSGFMKGQYLFYSYLLKRIADRFSKDEFYEGSWWGNDTVWRMIVDINRIFTYADNKGRLLDEPFNGRKVFNIIDGIVAGENDGPLCPTPLKSGLLICGINSLAVDTVMAQMMEFDFMKIPQIYNAYQLKDYVLTRFNQEDIAVIIDDAELRLNELKGMFFKPTPYWKGYIERKC